MSIFIMLNKGSILSVPYVCIILYSYPTKKLQMFDVIDRNKNDLVSVGLSLRLMI